MSEIIKERMYKLYLVLLSVVFYNSAIQAQQGLWKADIDYQVGLPVGNFREAVDEISPRGGSVGVYYGVTDVLSIGLEAGFQDFYKKYPRQTFHQSGYDLSAVVSNSIQIIPIL